MDVIAARYAELWQKRVADAAHVRPPGGETVGEVAARVNAAVDDIVRLHPEMPVLIVSHGLALATVICRARRHSSCAGVPEHSGQRCADLAGTERLGRVVL